MKGLRCRNLLTVYLSVAIAVLLFATPGFCTQGTDITLLPFAMGGRTEQPQEPQPAPKVAEPTLMIQLGGTQFDPLYKLPSPKAGIRTITAYEPEQTGYFIVQFDGPVMPQWKDALKQVGVEIFDYLPDFSFVVRMAAASTATVEAMPHVRWVGIFQPAFRISQKAMATLYSQGSEQDAPMTQMRVNLFPGVNLADIETQIRAAGGVVQERFTGTLKTTLKIEIPANRIADLPAIEGVKWVEPMPQWKLSNDVSTDIMNVRTPWNTHGLYGAGQVVGVADTGLDNGSTAPASLHDDFEDGSGGTRVLQIIERVSGDSPSDENGHGTHVAGSVLGNGKMSGSDPASNSFPTTAHAGMAPKASLVFQALEHNTNHTLDGIPADLNTLFGEADTAGAHLHTNSWGASVASDYTSFSQDVDEYMWNHPDFLILFSASNDGIDKDADGVIDLYSLGAPATAKNCLTVGASENDRPTGGGYDMPWATGSWADLYPAVPISTDHVSNNDRGMAAFSSRGPTLDGRYKPEIVAPGTNILSTRTGAVSTSTTIGWGNYDDNYVWMGGTSMATPLAAGAAALMREYLVDEEGFTTPSAALIKAALINSAEDISPGQYGTSATQEIPDSPVPNNVEGWGRLNLGDGVFPTAPFDILFYDNATGLNTSGYTDYNITVTDAGAPLRITLAWTDYPGSPTAQGALVNDLDLQVTTPSASVLYPDQASQKAALTTLYYDSDSIAGYLRNPTRFATRFTPTSYPVNLDSVTIFPYNNAPGTTVNIIVYDDNGSGGYPGTVLYTKAVPYISSAYSTIPIEGVTISSGDFYVCLEVTDTVNQGIFGDTTNSGRTYLYSSGSWQTSTYSWKIRAHVRAQDISTDFDRVNNTVGLTLDTPATGTYTVRVSGHNVPQGPQPYALVASGNITENAFGTLQFSAATYSVDEDAGTATITVTRTGGSDGAVSVDYATSNGTATAGSDYTAASGTLNWTDGDSASKTFTVSITDDSSNEGNETINLTLSNVTGGAAIGTNDDAVLTIQDDDIPGTLQFSAATYSVNEDAGTATITVTRTGGSDGAVSVAYATSNGTATAGSDYTTASGTLNWADGDSAGKTFTVTITDDGTVESNETVNLTLSSPTGGATLGTNDTAVLTIQDDEVPGVLQFSSATYSVNENAGTATITVTRTGGSDGAVSVAYATSNGTATAGSDYTTASGTLNWTDGDSASKTFPVTITDDSTGESNETINLTLSSPTGGAILGNNDDAVLTIVNDDPIPGTLQFSAATYSVNENAGTATITVTRTVGSDGAVSVTYATSDGTATEGSDYTAPTGTTLDWTDGDGASKTFTVDITDDGDDESNETITLTLSNPTGGAILGTNDTAVLTIVDNDGDGGGGGGGGGGGCFISTVSME